jgi:hypothetical protein
MPDWDREKMSSGRAYERPLAGRGHLGPQLLNPPERRKEWQQANHEWTYGNGNHLIELNTGQMLDPRRWCSSNNKHNTINQRIQP